MIEKNESFHFDLMTVGYFITKTYLYNFDLLKPHIYIVKLGLQGYILFFLFLLRNIDYGYSLEPSWRGGSNEYLHLWAEIWKYQNFLPVFGDEIFNIFE